MTLPPTTSWQIVPAKRSDHQTVTDGVLRHDLGLDEMQEVVGPARLGARAAETVAAEGLPPDHRARDRAIDVQIADRRPAHDALDGVRVAREEPSGEGERQRVD